MAFVCLIGFAISAVADWWAVARRSKPAEFVAKPATLAFLLLYAAAQPSAGWPLLAALMFSLLGDVYLMLPGDLFLFGLSAFLIGHVAYVGAIDAELGARILWTAGIVLLASPIGYRVVSAAPAAMRAPVAIYILAIVAMVGSAASVTFGSAATTGNAMMIGGALLFLASDSMIGWNRFVKPFDQAPLAIIVTYHLGQLGLVLGLTANN